ncbi:MAG: hypothetical protein Q8P67_22700 [archaeon]|nr:hypothetical protein [archaeon]
MKRLSELFDVNHFIVSQVNPHVVPFIPKTDAKPGLFSALLRSELAHRIHQVSMFLPFGELSMIVKQIYKGNITIVPSLGLRDFLGVVSSPTPDSLRHAILLGQRSTWPHVSYVRNHFQIEKVLEECTQRLRTQLFPNQFSRRLAWGSH